MARSTNGATGCGQHCYGVGHGVRRSDVPPAPKLTDISLITITGPRTTVSGKTVIPYFRFPGKTTFSQGSARPVITDGSFTWQRKTGKKFYAYVTSDDGVVKSNRVIIPAT